MFFFDIFWYEAFWAIHSVASKVNSCEPLEQKIPWNQFFYSFDESCEWDLVLIKFMIFQRWVLVGSSAYWFRVEPYSKYHAKISISACRNIMRHKLCPIIPKGRNVQIIYFKNEAIRMENNSMEITQVHTFSWKWINPIKSWITGQNLHYISQFTSGPAFSESLGFGESLKRYVPNDMFRGCFPSACRWSNLPLCIKILGIWLVFSLKPQS